MLFLLLFLGVRAGVTALCFMTMGPSPQAIVMPVWCLRPGADLWASLRKRLLLSEERAYHVSLLMAEQKRMRGYGKYYIFTLFAFSQIEI